ncbi:hypothetical protein Psch_02439 [Pelotomaculum schinkii]|uniref:Uncharacterized protein n=1 Tax=Pelotomaculum schinkii TaxID=78350 RepID=A0A4Y7R8V7_9FIRM|nr:hypothetical protein Psch_02439 [Pelotomaculum schinkii]
MLSANIVNSFSNTTTEETSPPFQIQAGFYSNLVEICLSYFSFAEASMIAIVKSTALSGLDGQIVEVEVDVSSGLPSFEIVGLYS